ncbi:diphthamide biosynthesis protein [Trametes elegans]|nr:diphthamide biosynthesis protein [Trametes elegans]
MAEVTTFSSSGAEVISRTIDVQEAVPSDLSPAELEDIFDISRTADQIERGDYHRIALQFPDELLPQSVPIFRILKSRIAESRELYVLADTSYGSCCVDEVAAQHVDADALVHYGHACMSQTSRLPVIYVLGKKSIDPSHCAETFAEALKKESSIDKKSVLLRHEAAYAHRAKDVIADLKRRLPSSTRILYTPMPLFVPPALSEQKRTPQSLQDVTVQRPQNGGESTQLDAAPEDSMILYLGGESLTLTNLLLTHAAYEVFAFDPRTRTTRLESGRTNRLLMRRYAVVQKARDADVIGILVGTLGVANYLPLIAHLRDIIKRAHKKSYTISVGKPNPSKLGNFLEIECFVLVACPENSLLDSKEFLRPIITPYELEVALQPTQTWTGRYVLDFDQLLREHEEGQAGRHAGIDPRPPFAEIWAASTSERTAEEEEDIDEPVFSLATGKYRHAKRYGGATDSTANGDGDSSAIVLRNQEGALSKVEDSAAAQFLQTRTFRGLEARIGQDEPSVLEQGRSGIARGYADDHRPPTPITRSKT